MFEERTVDDKRIGSPALLLVAYVFGPESIIVVEVVNRLKQRCLHGLLGVGVWFSGEVGHDLFHLGFDLILRDVLFILHDLRSLPVSAVLVEAACKSLHGVPLPRHLVFFVVHALAEAAALLSCSTLLHYLLFLFGVGAERVIVDLVELQLVNHLLATRDVHTDLV